jgi:hypothetical protein
MTVRAHPNPSSETKKLGGKVVSRLKDFLTTAAVALAMVIALPFIFLRAIFGHERGAEYWTAKCRDLDNSPRGSWGSSWNGLRPIHSRRDKGREN